MTELTVRFRDGAVTLLTLFTSSGTLVCCALPVTLVTLGFGSAVAGLTGTFPWLITLSRHKAWVFLISAVFLIFAGWMSYYRKRACPADPELASLCMRLDAWNRRIYWAAVAVWVTGFFAAYLLLPASRFFGLV